MYTDPKNPFELVRVWGRGGKTNVWGRVSLRYSDVDFAGPERDGWEIPWPIRYKDIAPYYDRVDQLIGVCGGDDDQDSLPGSKFHLPAPAPRCGERIMQRAAKQIGISIVAGRRAVLTRPIMDTRLATIAERAARDAMSARSSIHPTICWNPRSKRANSRSSITPSPRTYWWMTKALANGVQYFDRYTKEEHKVYAKRVVVAASCIDSTRLLLNSKSSAYPNGIGNSSDVIGRYLTEQVRFHMQAFAPELMGTKVMNDDGIGGEHIYMPRFNHRDGRKRDYLRGFGCQFWFTGASQVRHGPKQLPGFGADFKKSVKQRFPALLSMHPYGEVLPRADNRVTVDGTPLDRYGIPQARIIFTHARTNARWLPTCMTPARRF